MNHTWVALNNRHADPTSVPDNGFGFFADPAVIGAGNVCRYQIAAYETTNMIPDPSDTTGMTMIPAGATFAVAHDLPPALDMAGAFCPGDSALATQAVLLAGVTPDQSIGGVQIARADALLLTPAPASLRTGHHEQSLTSTGDHGPQTLSAMSHSAR